MSGDRHIWLVAGGILGQRSSNSFPGMLTQAPLAPLGKQEEPDNMELVSQPHPVQVHMDFI